MLGFDPPIFVGARAQLFEFGDKHRGKYDRSVAAARSYYASVSGYNDELLWAALWLHLATDAAGGGVVGADSGYYLEYVVKKGHELGGTGWAINEFSWDIKYAGVQILAAKVSCRNAVVYIPRPANAVGFFR